MEVDINKVYIQIPSKYVSGYADVFYITGSNECMRTVINFKAKTLNLYRNNSDSFGYNFNNYVAEINKWVDKSITYEFDSLKETRIFLKNFKLVNKLRK